MTLPCDLIRNSFEAYEAGTCSLATKKLIEEHFVTCPECSQAYETWLASIQKKEEQNYRELKSLSRKLKIDRRKKIIKWTLISLIIISIVTFLILLILGVEVRRQ